MKDYRLVVLGSGGVGKTSLIYRFLKGHFLDHYIPTVEDIHRPIIQLPDGDIHGVEILDTAGFHQFPAMRRLSIQSGKAFIVVFDLVDYSTLEEALNVIDSINEIKGEDVPLIMVGNKCDLYMHRAVTSAAMLKLAESRGLSYIETSARFDYNIQKVFLRLLTEVFKDDKSLPEDHKGVRRLSWRLRRAMRGSWSSNTSTSSSAMSSSSSSTSSSSTRRSRSVSDSSDECSSAEDSSTSGSEAGTPKEACFIM